VASAWDNFFREGGGCTLYQYLATLMMLAIEENYYQPTNIVVQTWPFYCIYIYIHIVLNKRTIPSLGHIFGAHVFKVFPLFFKAKDLPDLIRCTINPRVGWGGRLWNMCNLWCNVSISNFCRFSAKTLNPLNPLNYVVCALVVDSPFILIFFS